MDPIMERWNLYVNEGIQANNLCLAEFPESNRGILLVPFFTKEFMKDIFNEMQRPPQELIKMAGESGKKASFPRTFKAFSKPQDRVKLSEGIMGVLLLKRPQKNQCFESFEVQASAVNREYRGKGYGKLLYSLGMAYAYPRPIMADRAFVSTSARNIWKSMVKNQDLEKRPPDDPPFMGKFDDKNDPSTKPRVDDCDIHDDDYLNVAYASDKDTNLYNELKGNYDKFKGVVGRLTDNSKIKYYKPIDTDELHALIHSLGNSFFSANFSVEV